jgi:ABC-type phosphate transport system permease subunit
MISSDETRQFLHTEPIVKYVGIAVVCLMAVMHLLTLYDLYDKSLKIRNKSPLKDELLQAIVSSYEIKRKYVAARFLINGLLYIWLITILLSVN